MSSLDEKRVYGEKEGSTAVFVATEMGVAAVNVAADRVGEFSIVDRRAAGSVAAAGGTVAAATDEDVLVRRPDGDGFETVGVGPATAVGFDGQTLLAATEDDQLVRVGEDDFETLAEDVPSVRAIDGDLLATADGVYRVGETGVQYVGLSDVRDVSSPGLPLAAAPDALYRLGNGWMEEIPGDFHVVSADPVAAGSNALGRAHAATEGALYEHADEWQSLELPVDETVVGVGYAESVYAITASGTLLADAGDGWRSHPLGFRGVAGLAVSERTAGE